MSAKKRKRLFYFFGMSNCFFFAWYMFFTKGGYCAIRRSRHITGWHWLWSPPTKKHRYVHYEPVEPKKEWWKAAFHKILYKGIIRRGDEEYINSHYDY